MKKSILTALSTTLLIYSCSSNSNNSLNSIDTSLVDSSSIITDTTDLNTVNKTGSNWEYYEEEDKMTSNTNYYASITSPELLYFNSPYEGGSTSTLTIRKIDNRGSIYLSVSKGQFMTHTSGTNYRIRFDKELAESCQVSNPSDGSSDIVFFNYKNLINKIKQHKKMIIQAEFYQEGFKTIEFNISDLKWDH